MLRFLRYYQLIRQVGYLDKYSRTEHHEVRLNFVNLYQQVVLSGERKE